MLCQHLGIKRNHITPVEKPQNRVLTGFDVEYSGNSSSYCVAELSVERKASDGENEPIYQSGKVWPGWEAVAIPSDSNIG
jgi:hypothetical protein